MDNNEGVEAQTTIDTIYKATCGFHTDVQFQQYYINYRTLGYAPCISRIAGSTRCDRRAVRINWQLIQTTASNPNFEARHTLCHEVGHSLGANHYTDAFDNPDGFLAPNSCMISGIWDNGSLASRSYGPDHRAHINAWF